MRPNEPLVAVSQPAPSTHRIAIMSMLGPRVAGLLEAAVQEAIRAGATRIELDLSATRVAEPDDLLCLVDVHWRTSRARAALALINVPSGVAEQMSRTLLPALLPIR